MNVVLYSILGTISFLFILIFWSSLNQYTSTEVRINSGSYVMSIKPVLVEEGKTVQILLNQTNNTPNSVVLIVMDPGLDKFELQDGPIFGNHKYPRDFNAASTIAGNYSVFLINKTSDKIIISTVFKAESFWSILSSFVFGKGLGLFVGIFIPGYSYVIQEVGKRREEYVKRMEGKLNWLESNMKHYLDLERGARGVSGLLEVQTAQGKQAFCSTNCKPEQLLKALIEFISSYQNFAENLGYYYFDNLRAEVFLVALRTRIREQLTRVLGEPYESFFDFAIEYLKDPKKGKGKFDEKIPKVKIY